MQKYLLSCDWGTSSFRLRLVDIGHDLVIAEELSGMGAGNMYSRWKAGEAGGEANIEQYYLRTLEHHIQMFTGKLSADLRNVPIAVSGMASSGIGMREVPYAALPFALDGSHARVQCIYQAGSRPRKVYLISGVSSSRDAMRGEETQVVGLAAMNIDVYGAENTICILPGTHSKHIHLHKGKIVDFQTYMTGELFHVMSHQSILKDAVSDQSPSTRWEQSHIDSFRRGVHDSKKSNLLHALFAVRINQLFKLLGKEDNFYYLSGLLIGSELKDISEKTGIPVILCSGSSMYMLYELAIQEMNIQSRTTFIDAAIMDKSVIAGHIRILQHQTD